MYSQGLHRKESKPNTILTLVGFGYRFVARFTPSETFSYPYIYRGTQSLKGYHPPPYNIWQRLLTYAIAYLLASTSHTHSIV